MHCHTWDGGWYLKLWVYLIPECEGCPASGTWKSCPELGTLERLHTATVAVGLTSWNCYMGIQGPPTSSRVCFSFQVQIPTTSSASRETFLNRWNGCIFPLFQLTLTGRALRPDPSSGRAAGPAPADASVWRASQGIPWQMSNVWPKANAKTSPNTCPGMSSLASHLFTCQLGRNN